jgi:hypothetical protein
MVDHTMLSENAVKLLIAASKAERNFANRFKVMLRPDLISIGDFKVEGTEALRLLGEIKTHGLAEPEGMTESGLWRLTARGIAETEYRKTKSKLDMWPPVHGQE